MPQMDAFFRPESIAVFGASEKEDSMGGIILKNLQKSQFAGKLWAVNLRGYDQVFDVPCKKNIQSIPEAVDLAIFCLPKERLVKQLAGVAKAGTKAVLILTGGISRQQSLDKKQIVELREEAQALGIRLLGPNCLGILVPSMKMNASFAHIDALPGNMAFVGQSASMGSALLDWATGRGIGFSHFMTVGVGADIRVSDILDYLASDRRVKTILLHFEYIRNRRRLMIALRSVARTKKVIVIKTANEDVVPHGLKSRDGVDHEYFSRAGVLEVDNFDDLFSSVEVLNRQKPLYRQSLALLGNGLGPGMLARQSMQRWQGKIADLSRWKQDIPSVYVNKNGEAQIAAMPPQSSALEIGETLKLLDKDPEIGAILFIHSPNMRSSSKDVARDLVPIIKKCRHTVLTVWLGDASVDHARKLFDQHGLLNFESPNEAVAAFMTMVRFEQNQELMRETPSNLLMKNEPKQVEASLMLGKIIESKRDYLTWLEARQLLEYYGINTIDSRFNEDVEVLIDSLGVQDYPVALRLVHSEYCYPFAYEKKPTFRWRAVKVELQNEQEIRDAAEDLINTLLEQFPQSKVLGFGIQPMRRKIDSLQFSMGMTRDPVYGPLILFGEGGTAADILADRQLGLPPLNQNLAKQIIYKSHIYNLLLERSNQLEQEVNYLCEALITISQMCLEQPMLSGVEVNFLLTAQGVIALGTGISLGEPLTPAIAPYPEQYNQTLYLKDKELFIRAIKGEDELQLKALYSRLDPEDLRLRFFGSRLKFEHRELATMCQIDYEREMAFVTLDEEGVLRAEVRTWLDVTTGHLEFAIIVDRKMKGHGLGVLLMEKIINYGRKVKAKAIVADVLTENKAMLGLSTRLGFEIGPNEDGVRIVTLAL